MKSCPGCEFLIDDAVEVCEFCSADPGYSSELQGFTTKRTVVGALADPGVELGGAVGVLERPVPSGVDWSQTEVPSKHSAKSKSTPTEERFEFRRESTGIPVPLVLGVVALVVVAAVVLSVTGHGPLAAQFTEWGLGRPQSVVLPSDWHEYGDVAGKFTAELPGESQIVFEPLDAAGAVPGGLVGSRVAGNADAYVFAGSSDMGLGPGGLKAYESDEGVAELAARFASIRIPGKLTISRSSNLPYGNANDSVYVVQNSNGTSTETRLRVVLAGDSLHQLITSGPESDALELDAAHQRMVGSFTPTR